jgi:hypothetical protein
LHLSGFCLNVRHSAPSHSVGQLDWPQPSLIVVVVEYRHVVDDGFDRDDDNDNDNDNDDNDDDERARDFRRAALAGHDC